MKTSPLSGTRDILPAECTLRDWVLSTVLATYAENGFQRISTPIIEDAENISKSDGGDNLNLVFRVLKRGDKFNNAIVSLSNKCSSNSPSDTGNQACGDDESPIDCLSDIALRYDLTLPLVRFYSAHKGDLPLPFKVIQSDRVYRAERPQKGRLREFQQCDIDIIGDPSINAEIELIDITTRALEKVGFTGFCVHINDRRLLRTMLLGAGFNESELQSVSITYDKLDKVGLDGVLQELRSKGLNENAICALGQQISSNTIGDLQKLGNEADNLRHVIDMSQKLSNGRYNVQYTPSLVRGQGYYTDLVFEITVAGCNGAIAGGGRYDHMVEKFTGQSVPAVGFSIGFERICALLQERGFIPPLQNERCVLFYADEPFDEVLRISKELQKTYSVLIIRKAKKMGPQYSMLEKAGYTHFAQIIDGNPIIK